MALVCPFCGAENRDKARFCRGCARALEQPGAADPSKDKRERRPGAAERARRRRRAAAKAASPSRSRWVGAVVLAALALGIGWWLGARQTGPAPVQAVMQPAIAAPATPVAPAPTAAVVPPAAAVPTPEAARLPATISTATSPESVAAVDRLRQSVEMLERQDRVRAAVLEQQRLKAAQDKQRAEEARRRADALAASATAVPTPSANVGQGSPPVATVAAAAPPTVDQLCAGSDNVFARDFCRIRECGKPGYANDPVCIRFRQMEEARRQEANHR